MEAFMADSWSIRRAALAGREANGGNPMALTPVSVSHRHASGSCWSGLQAYCSLPQHHKLPSMKYFLNVERHKRRPWHPKHILRHTASALLSSCHCHSSGLRQCPRPFGDTDLRNPVAALSDANCSEPVFARRLERPGDLSDRSANSPRTRSAEALRLLIAVAHSRVSCIALSKSVM